MASQNYDPATEARWSAWLNAFRAFLKAKVAHVERGRPWYEPESCEYRCGKHASDDAEYCDWGECSDHQQWCEICGVILDHGFTEYGVREELCHLADPEQTNPLSPEDAFIVLNCVYCDSETHRNMLIAIANKFNFHFPT